MSEQTHFHVPTTEASASSRHYASPQKPTSWSGETAYARPVTASWEHLPSGANDRIKRMYDVLFSLSGLVLLSPVFIVVGALVKIADGGDIFYRQVRVGQGGREFSIYKFRSMVCTGDQTGPSVTKNGDARVTWIGRILRKAKLDELPQLWNVLKGEMSLVGPRPEVPRYTNQYTPEQRAILRHKPGITDLASLCFRNEEELLANAENVEDFYVKHCIPRKLQLNQIYTRRANVLSDTWIILQTLCPYWVGVLACYGVLLASSFWGSYVLANNFTVPDVFTVSFGSNLAVALILQLACLAWRTQCRGLLSYLSFTELRRIGGAMGMAAVGLLGWSLVHGRSPAPNVIFIDALLAFCLLCGFRLLLRSWREKAAVGEGLEARPRARVGIIGAGSTGAQLALELAGNGSHGRIAVAFFDDDFHKWQKLIHDVPVAGMPECLLEGWADKLDEVVIAMPDAPAERVHEIERLVYRTCLKSYNITCLARFWKQQEAA